MAVLIELSLGRYLELGVVFYAAVILFVVFQIITFNLWRNYPRYRMLTFGFDFLLSLIVLVVGFLLSLTGSIVD